MLNGLRGNPDWQPFRAAYEMKTENGETGGFEKLENRMMKEERDQSSQHPESPEKSQWAFPGQQSHSPRRDNRHRKEKHSQRK